MPTTKPRYTVTDTGEIGAMIDLAARRWPEVTDRKALLVRLAAAGHDRVSAELAERDERRARQGEAFRRIRELVDLDVLRSDEAWH